ncbi:Hsp20/alpha crystallin family protein [Ectothiorhodospiraceae bacterium 2226]|nr:Hsp20/alpha crystallin family protein [Ectothiorhodospiraceae bacterium 2226]
MDMVRYEPWTLLNRLHREIDSLFDQRVSNGESTHLSTADWTPAVDIRDTGDAFVLHADVPGVDPKDIDISMENGVLTLRGERRHETEEERAGYKRVERVRGNFYRRFSLPDSADAEKITAKCDQGVLEITIPKQEKVQPRKIQVQS